MNYLHNMIFKNLCIKYKCLFEFSLFNNIIRCLCYGKYKLMWRIRFAKFYCLFTYENHSYVRLFGNKIIYDYN